MFTALTLSWTLVGVSLVVMLCAGFAWTVGAHIAALLFGAIHRTQA